MVPASLNHERIDSRPTRRAVAGVCGLLAALTLWLLAYPFDFHGQPLQARESSRIGGV